MDSQVCTAEKPVSKSKKRLFYLDVLRVIACLCVIMVHVSAGYAVKDFGSFDFWVGNIFDSLSRIGVPLFVMISGAVFLDENYSFTVKKLVGHILKIVLFFVFWSACYSFYNNMFIPLRQGKGIYLKSFIADTITGHYHLWFCFMIVGLYLIVPLLRVWIKKENIGQVRYFLILSAIFAMFLPSALEYVKLLIPSFNLFTSVLDNVNLRYVGGFTSYFILGWYLNNYEIKHKRAVVLLGVAGILVSILGTAFLSITLNESHTTYGNLTVHVAMQAVMVFMLCKDKYKEYIPEKSIFTKVISFASKHSFGVYGIHAIVLDYVFAYATRFGITFSLVKVVVVFIATYLISLGASFILSKIPLLKKVV